MGRPRIITANNRKHFTKSELEERKAVEEAYKLETDELQPFDYLSDNAKAEFEFIKQSAFWLDNLDRMDLNLYCFYCDRLMSIMRDYGTVNEDGEFEIPPDVIEMKGGDGISKLIKNPLIKVMKDYHAEIRKLSSKLGIATIDRLKLAPPKVDRKPNKFLRLLK